MPYQPKLGSEYRTGYIKTLIKTNELLKDLEKMEFLSIALTDPKIKFYAVRPTTRKMAENDIKNSTK